MDILRSKTGATVYNLKREIARGGMGAVYEAEQVGVELFTKTVAIKTILEKFLSNAEFVERFIGEAKLVANLVHPNIVQIYQLDSFSGGYFIAMEYIDGITAHEFMRMHEKKSIEVPVDYVTFIISRIARGLEHAHLKADRNGNLLGIVHRDVCPKNIMITSEGEGKLTDFGVAKAAQFFRDQEGEVLLGKVQYMSPEQANLKHTDGRSDLFSLGVVYYEMLTGVNPFKQENPMDCLKMIRKAEVKDPRRLRPDIPEDVAAIVMKALARDLDDRFRSASEMGTALEVQMYSKGYGPTIKKLADYMREHFPEQEMFQHGGSMLGAASHLEVPETVVMDPEADTDAYKACDETLIMPADKKAKPSQ